MTEPAMLQEMFAPILSRLGITAPITAIDASNFRDAPGFHWANPGLKLVTVTTGSDQHTFVVKRLRLRSRREVPIYHALSTDPTFPMPRLHHSIYDEATNDYLLVLEQGVPHPGAKGAAFWREAGLLLARIHTSHWDRTDDLPPVLHLPRPEHQAWEAITALVTFFDGLSDEARGVLRCEATPMLPELRSALAAVDRGRLPVAPPRARCLIHKAFHQPEMIWRRTDTGYEPLAVDWETACVGAPEEDFGVVANLIAEEEHASLSALRSAYLGEMRRLGATVEERALWTAILSQTLCDKIRLLPWLIGQYFRVRDDPGFENWSRWASGAISQACDYVQRCTIRGDLYQST